MASTPSSVPSRRIVRPGSPCSSMKAMAAATMRSRLSGTRCDGSAAPATTCASGSVGGGSCSDMWGLLRLEPTATGAPARAPLLRPSLHHDSVSTAEHAAHPESQETAVGQDEGGVPGRRAVVPEEPVRPLYHAPGP